MMKKAEISFPRGKNPIPFLGSSTPDSSSKGKKLKKGITEPKSTVTRDDDDLFKLPKFKGANEGKSKKKKRGLTTEEADLLSSDTPQAKVKNVIDVLSYETITEGMLSLGRIIKVRDHEILVSLPGRTMGSVPITSISAPYTKALETLTAAGNSEDPVYGVDDLFQVGQVVSVAVVGVKKEGHSYRVTLSMAPNDLQAAYSPDSICESMVLTGAVASVEDHGYIIDIGISGTSAFLRKEHATAFIQHQNGKRPLGIGQLLKCKVMSCKSVGKSKSTKQAHVTLTISPKEIRNSRLTLETITNYQLLLPGMESEGTVMTTHKTGLKVDFLDTVGHIHLDHMVDAWTPPESLEVGATIYPHVLYTLPNSNDPALTLQSRLCQKKHEVGTSQLTLTLGSKVKVKIARIEKRGLIIRFDGGERGFVASTRCSDNSAFTDDDIAKSFPTGSSHTCCVLEYSSLDNMYIASFQQSVLNQAVVRIDQLSVGQVVSCDLKAWKPNGAIVGVGLAKGFIPKLHFGELALKNPSVKFPVGSHFNGRVCKIDTVKNQMMLTAKKRLVKSSLPILSTFEECTYGTAAEGVISRVSEHGLNIYTVGGLPAFIPASKATLEDKTNLPRLFFPGQVVQFHVLNANQKENRIILSLLFDESKVKPRVTQEEVPPISEPEKEPKPKKLKKSKSKEIEVETPIVNGKNSHANDKDEGKVQKNTKKTKRETTGESEPPKKKAKREQENVVEHGEKASKKKMKRDKENVAEDEEKAAKKKAKPAKANVAENGEKAAKKKKVEKDVADVVCLEGPADDFYDTSYLEKSKAGSDSDLSGDEGEEHKSRKDRKRKKKGQDEKKEKVNSVEVDEKEEAKKGGGFDKFAANSVTEFEKLLLASPNNGKLWCSYINFVLRGADVEDARAIAVRGIRTILFREEAEKLQVWKAWLNVEATYGTEETLKKVFDEALKANDPLSTYQAMAEIHGRKGNVKEQENLVYLMTKKFAETKNVWFDAVNFYYKNGDLDKGRTVFKTALEKLPKTEHINVISKTAVLEFKYGDIGRGRTLLDTTLRTYPKRLDLWLLYTGQLIKKGEYDLTRETFENAVKVAFVPKRMLSLLKKYLEFEIEHGAPENRQRVKEQALKYVNSTMPQLTEAFENID